MQLYFQLLAWCRRKKDHGRAEALLLAAWGIGFRRSTVDAAAANAEALAELDDLDNGLNDAEDSNSKPASTVCAAS